MQRGRAKGHPVLSSVTTFRLSSHPLPGGDGHWVRADREVTVADSDGFDALIEAETQLAARIAAAEAEAEATLGAAQLMVETLESRHEADVALAASALETHITARRDTEIERIQAAAVVEVRRFQGLPSARGEALADQVVRQVLDAWNSEAGS